VVRSKGDVGMASGGGSSLDELVLPSNGLAATSTMVLVKHLAPETSELEVADAFRVFAPIKQVVLVQDPRPGAPKNPSALVEFYDASSAAHCVASALGLPQGGVTVNRHTPLARPLAAKPTALAVVAAWAQQRQQAQTAQQAREQAQLAAQQRLHEMRQVVRQAAAGGNHKSGGRPTSPPREGAVLSERMRVVAPEWPPSFDEDGAAWVFDPASGYFVHGATCMYYEPKAKWYCKASTPQGSYTYYQHAPGHRPPYVPRSNLGPPQPQGENAAQAAGSASSAAAAAAARGSRPQDEAARAAAEAAAQTAAAAKAAAKAEKKLNLAMKKNLKEMAKWKDRASKEGALVGEAAAPVGVGGGGVDLVALGSDYTSVGRLGLLPEPGAAAAGSAPGPLCEGSGSRWACLVSRRCFPSEDQLAKHVRVSKLYREELLKAVQAGRVVLKA